MASVPSVEASMDGGLSGDRYAEAKNRRAPHYQATLIELENIEAGRNRIGSDARSASEKHRHLRSKPKFALW
jgi:hypothetical protein